MYTTTVPIEVRTPFAGGVLLEFLAHRAVAGVERVDGATYTRSVRLTNGFGIVRLTLTDLPGGPAGGSVPAEVLLSDPDDADEAAVLCRRLVDAEADPTEIDAAVASDPRLAADVAATPGIRLPGAADGPEILFRAMFGQQVSVAAARTTLAGLAARLGEPLPANDAGLVAMFPTAAAFADAGPDAIPGPRRRAQAIITAAESITSGVLILDGSRSGAELTADLVVVPGIGPWTAGYVTMRLLGDPDVLLTGDLVLRQGAAARGIPADPRTLAEYGLRWRPFRSYAGLHLWRAVPPSRTAMRK